MRQLYFSTIVVSMCCISVLAGCGGSGGQAGTPPPPPPPPASFAIDVSPSLLTLAANSTAQAIVSITSENGFASSVMLSAQGLPNGISASFSPATIQGGQTSELTLTANGSVNIGQASFSVNGTGGGLPESKGVQIQIVALGKGTPPHAILRRTDGFPAGLAYDSGHKQLFVAVTDLDLVYVFSTKTSQLITTIPVPQPAGIDITMDGKRLVVGSLVQELFLIDTNSLQVVQAAPLPATISGFSCCFTERQPRYVGTASNGKVLIVSYTLNLGSTALLEWDPSSGVFKALNGPNLPSLPGFIVRTADHSKILVSTLGNVAGAGVLVGLYDSASDSFSNALVGGGRVDGIAANPTGSQFAINLAGSQILILDGNLNVLQDLNIQTAGDPFYNSDGSLLYYFSALSGEPPQLGAAVTALNTTTFAAAGQVPAPSLAVSPGDRLLVGLSPAIDENNVVYTDGDHAIGLTDVSRPMNILAGPLPTIEAVNPPQGSVGALTPVTVSGSGFDSGTSIFFGDQPGISQQFVSTSVITTLVPPSVTPGPVQVTAVSSGGLVQILPDGFSYGPQFLFMTPSGGLSSGGTTAQIFGYGFDFPPSQMHVTVGGEPATIEGVGPSSVFAGFPTQALTVKTGAGTPGLSDVVITTPVGTATAPKEFIYLPNIEVVPVTGNVGQIVFDGPRQKLYLSNMTANHVEVYSLASKQFLTPFPSGTGPMGLALTPDGSLLVVANNGDGTITTLNPDNPSSPTTISLSPVSFGQPPTEVVTTGTGKAFVLVETPGVTGCGDELLEVDLTTHAVTRRTGLQCVVTPSLVTGSADGSEMAYADIGSSGGTIALWSAQTDMFTSTDLNTGAHDVSISGDGNVVAVQPPRTIYVLTPQLQLVQVPAASDAAALQATNSTGERFSPSGSLLFVPAQSAIRLYDVKHGSLKEWIPLPENLANQVRQPITVDDTGEHLFVVTASGFTVVDFSAEPLSVGSVNPSQGGVAGGTAVTIRGSGFQVGTTVSFGGTPAATMFVNNETLTVVTPPSPVGAVQMVVKTPDAQTYALDAAFQYQ
jgi:WD40 repeat protein